MIATKSGHWAESTRNIGQRDNRCPMPHVNPKMIDRLDELDRSVPGSVARADQVAALGVTKAR